MTSEMARHLRREATEAEKVLWRLPRNRSLVEALEGTRLSPPSPGRPRRSPSPTEERGFT